MITNTFINRKNRSCLAGIGLVIALLLLLLVPFRAQAANVQKIDVSESSVRMAIGETKTLTVDYSRVAGGYADIGIVATDPSILQVTMQDAGNAKAVLAIQTTGFGTACAAVYINSNMAVVSYVTVYSGMAEKGDLYTVMDGDSLLTVYNDRTVSYKSTLTGKNGACLTVEGMQVERNSGVDCLKVTGELAEKDQKLPGMNTFYADFYDAGGNLIKRQAVYAGNPLTYNRLTLPWYIPEGCTKIVLE